MIKFRQWLVVNSMAFLLCGCNLVVLNPKGVVADGEKQLFLIAVGLMLIVVIPVIILNLVFAWRYRANNTKAKYSPDFAHNTLLEIIWWTIPIIIIGILAVITWYSSHRFDPYRPLDTKTKPLVIQVIALDWKWLFIYPKQQIATINYVQFPINVPVRFHITADAPMNSFQIPQLAGQIYAMPGMRTQLNVLATHTGDYLGISANYSGVGFSGMTFTARVSSEKDFAKWIREIKNTPQQLTPVVYEQLAKPSKDNPQEFFSMVSPDLFNQVIMKFMMPMPQPVPQKVTP